MRLELSKLVSFSQVKGLVWEEIEECAEFSEALF